MILCSSRVEPLNCWTFISWDFKVTYIKKWVKSPCNMLGIPFIAIAIYLIPFTIMVNISINRCCRSPRSSSDNSVLFYYTQVWILSEYYSNVWVLAVRHFGGIYFLIYDWKDISHGKSPCMQVSILVFLYFAWGCNVNFEEIFSIPRC